MNMTVASAILLIGILVFGCIVLHLDAQRRRMSQRLAAALPENAIQHDRGFGRVHLRRNRPWTDRILRFVFKYEADAPRAWPVHYMVLIGIGIAVATIVVSQMAFPLWIALIDGFIVGCLTIRTLFGWQQNRYADRLVRQLPDTIQLIVGAVRAGLPVAEAFRAVAREMPAPTKDQFGLVTNDIALGRPADEALRSVYERTHVAEYAMFSVTLAVQSRAGGGLAETLQTLGDTIRQRVALAGRAKALASEAKLSARVLSALPFLAGMALYLERPDSLNPLFYDPRGRTLFVAGITSLMLGMLTMRRMIRKGTTV